MSKITIALEILGDGKWHGIEELLLSLNLSQHEFRELTSFLNAYSLVKVDERNERLKINSDFRKLLT